MTSRLLSAVPLLAVADIDRGVAFWRDNLRFDAVYVDGDTAVLKRDDVSLHLWRCADRTIAQNTACRMQVDGIDQLYAHCRARDIVHPNGALALKPWGLREFTAIDPQGGAITFFEQPPRSEGSARHKKMDADRGGFRCPSPLTHLEKLDPERF